MKKSHVYSWKLLALCIILVVINFILVYLLPVLSEESSRVLKARQRTQARFESFLQDKVAADKRFEKENIIKAILNLWDRT